MNNTLAEIATRPLTPRRLLHAPARDPIAMRGRRFEDRQFLAMEQAYRASGGVLSGDRLASLLCRRSQQPISIVARWIVSRQVVCFEWQALTLLPLFQFDLSTVTLRACVAEIVQELADTFDDWHLAWWFAQPNARLGEATPVHMIDRDAQAVLTAARADRLIARG